MGSQGKRMPPSKALQSDSNYQDLEFLTEIKDEVLVSPSNNKCPTTSDHGHDHSELSVYLGMRRNSSFADYFEGDLSQNLLSRRHFKSSSTKSGLISTLVNKIRADGQIRSKVEGDGILGRSFETMMPSHWFFINRKLVDSDKELAPVQRRRAFTTPTQSERKGEEEEEEDSAGRKPSSLSKIISKHFSATRDVRAFNIN